MGKNVLVTGANGFIGQETVRALETGGWNVFRGVRHARHEKDISLDIDSPGFICELHERSPMDAIVHLAAKIGWDGATLQDQFMPNVVAVASLLGMVKQWGARFVFASAVMVDDDINIEYANVGAPLIPHPYVYSKWLSERLVEASGVPSAILRIGGVYGIHGPKHLGLNQAIESASRGQCPVMIGNGLAKRNYIYVKDVARAIAFALERDISGTHVISGTESLSIAAMLECVCDVFMPEEKPVRVNGVEAKDQVYAPSAVFPTVRSFRAGLEDILAGLRGQQ